MLAQSFKSADELGITEPQRDALCKTLVLLETGKLSFFDITTIPDQHFGHDHAFSGHFSMGTFSSNHQCGTAACIAGTAELISGVKFVGLDRSEALEELFYANGVTSMEFSNITPAQAATALRSYLTCGDAKWHEAVS